MKRLLKILGIVAASFLLLFVGGTFAVYLLVDFDRLANEKAQEAKPQIEEALGRGVELGPIATRFFPSLTVEISSIEVAGRTAEEPPLLQVDAVSVDVAIWQAILSLGKRLEVKEIAIHGPRLHLRRDADGLSIDDLLEPKEEAGEEERAPLQLPQGLRLASFQIRDAAVDLVDATDPEAERVETIRSVNLSMRDLSADRPIHLDLSLAAFGPEPNLSLSFVAGPLGALPPLGIPTLRDLLIQADDVDLSRLAPYLGEAAADLERARLSAQVRAPLIAPAAATEIDAVLELAQAQLVDGQPFDLRATLRGAYEPEEASLTLDDLSLVLGEMRLGASGAIHSLDSIPRFEAFVVESERLDLGTLLALLPSLGDALPPESEIAGPMALHLEASGSRAEQTIAGAVDLGGAKLWLPGLFAKEPGTPLSLGVDATLSQVGATLRSLRLQVADLDLQVAGAIPTFSPLTYDLTFSAEPFSLDRMVRLSPSVTTSLQEAGASAAGSGRLKGHAKGGDGAIDAALSLSLSGADLDVPQAQVEGDLHLQVTAEGDLAGDVRGSLLLDGGDARLRVDGLVDKAKRTPLHVDIQGARQGDRLRFSEFDVRLAALRLEAEGALALEEGASALSMRLPPVDLGALSQTFLFLPEIASSGRLEGAFSFTGDPTSPETIHATIPSFGGRLGKSDFQVKASLQDLTAPVIEGELRSSFLDLDELRGAAPEGEGAQERAPREDSPWLKTLQATFSVNVQRAKLMDRDLNNVVGKAVLKDGILTMEEARLNLYGGAVTAAGSEAEIWLGRMPFSILMEATGVDVQAAIAGETGKRSPLTGRGDLSMKLQGLGTEKVDLSEHLRGLWTLSMKDGRVVGPDIRGALLGGFDSLPVFNSQRVATDRQLRDLFGAFEVVDGKMELQEPLALSIGGDRLVLGGAIGIFGDLFLSGSYSLSPKVISTLSGGRCPADGPLEIPLSITGQPSAPSVKGDAAKIAANLAKTCLSGAAQDAVEQVVGVDAAKAAREKADAIRAEAQREAEAARLEAERAAQEARAEAERRARALREEAERKKRAAEEEAKKKARDAAGNLRDRLGF